MSDRYHLRGLGNSELLAGLSALPRQSNELTAQLLAHLVELEERMLHLEPALRRPSIRAAGSRRPLCAAGWQRGFESQVALQSAQPILCSTVLWSDAPCSEDCRQAGARITPLKVTRERSAHAHRDSVEQYLRGNLRARGALMIDHPLT